MEKIIAAPLAFKPYLKSVIWGGNKICGYKGLADCEEKIGESWEISAVPGHESVVEGGRYDGLKITDLIDRYGESLLGSKVVARYGNSFPLLIKIIDAADNLSVQVHPDDELARERHGSLGKTEMWYIIDTDKDAKIYAGLSHDSSPEEYEAKVADGTFQDLLAVHDSHPGDVFFLPAGRVHAIGAGNLLAEIQESSDVTYRIFDYNRRDAQGNPRELHTQLAKDAIDYKFHNDYKSPAPDAAVADAEIVKCDHFAVRRIVLSSEMPVEFNGDSFAVVMCVKGKCEVYYRDKKIEILAGQTVLLPADLCALSPLKLKGDATLLTAQA